MPVALRCGQDRFLGDAQETTVLIVNIDCGWRKSSAWQVAGEITGLILCKSFIRRHANDSGSL
jgi:hypothetical protein